MDLTRNIRYRGFEFNSVAIGTAGVAEGCTVDQVEYGDVEVDGYTEKSSLKDGYDASDVFLGRRMVTLRGMVHGHNRGALYDLLRSMRFAVSPRLAYRDAREAKGFYPLEFSEPTNLKADWDDGVIDLMLKCRSMGGVRTNFFREKTGGDDEQAISVPYEVRFMAIDPKVYLRQRAESYISGGAGNLELENRGGYPVPLNMLLVASPNTTQDRIFTFVGGGADFTARFPASAEVQVLRLDGEKRTVTLTVNDTETTAMHLFDYDSEWPELPLGLTDVAWEFKKEDGTAGSLNVNSLLWHREAFA